MTDTASSSDESVQRMCDLLTGMAKALADDPERIHVESEGSASETMLRLFVAPDDLGRLMGKQGRTARSLRTIVSAAGGKLQHRFNLDVQPEQ